MTVTSLPTNPNPDNDGLDPVERTVRNQAAELYEPIAEDIANLKTLPRRTPKERKAYRSELRSIWHAQREFADTYRRLTKHGLTTPNLENANHRAGGLLATLTSATAAAEKEKPPHALPLPQESTAQTNPAPPDPIEAEEPEPQPEEPPPLPSHEDYEDPHEWARALTDHIEKYGPTPT